MTTKPKVAVKKASGRKAKTASPDSMPTMDQAEFDRLLRRADFEEGDKRSGDHLLLLLVFFKPEGDALLSAMEALRFEIVKREIARVVVEFDLDDEEFTYTPIWEDDTPERLSGVIAIEADRETIFDVLEAIDSLPIHYPGVLQIPHENEELRDIFADFEPQVEIVVAAARPPASPMSRAKQ
jgi:hypothetical protein